MIKIKRFTLNNFRFFGEDNNVFDVGTKNVLIYGENGSGKSSIYKAFGLLGYNRIAPELFAREKNRFNADGDEFVEFVFVDSMSKEESELRIDEDHLDFEGVDFVHKISVIKPFLDYKKLLKIHYETAPVPSINLYEMFEILLENYPIDETGLTLKEIKEDLERYIPKLGQIVAELEEPIREILSELSDTKVSLNAIRFSPIGRSVYLDIDYCSERIDRYHDFLNEARLSALAMSVYFASILHVSTLLGENDLKLLVIDDLLISLDMGNRMKLIPILQSRFGSFQILFLTHDRALFEIYKEKLGWKGFEIFVDESGDYEKPILKLSNTFLEKAIEHFARKEYDCTANFLRKACEGLLSKWLAVEAFNQNCEKFQLNDLLQRGISKATRENANEIKAVLERLQTYRRTIFNPQSHHDDTPLYRQELKNAMDDVGALKLIMGI